ncbi:uncharacterized protein N7483_001643, partial [Penicillium malachiteum]|uniref:uncharacterized protein n=1 Tax=Penicillium malachiteum TaxID=1324776 RepID=UPI00254993DC
MTSTPEGLPTPKGKSRLIRHFEKRSIENHNDAWTDLWDTDKSDMWDRGRPSPALIDLLEQREEVLSPIAADSRRKTVLVLRCGKGYDVVMLVLHGFDVVGLEISQKGVSAAEYSEASKRERGPVSFIKGDFFKSESVNGRIFDVIQDYTFLCALHPTMRSQWALRMADLFIPGGLLVCLEFPLFKDPSHPGPPWPCKVGTGTCWPRVVMGFCILPHQIGKAILGWEAS